ncbi:MAG: CvpA family protein [Balneolaceae bacterium]
MNLLDLVIGLIVLLFAFQGFRNGIVREVLTIAGVVFAIFVALRLMEPLAGLLNPFLDHREDVIILISGLVLFTATFILVLVIAMLIRKFLEFIKLNIINRLFGFAFGGLKSVIAVSAVLLLLAGLDMPHEETRQGSFLYPYIIPVAPAAYNLAASAFPGSSDFMRQVQETLDENNPILNLSL